MALLIVSLLGLGLLPMLLAIALFSVPVYAHVGPSSARLCADVGRSFIGLAVVQTDGGLLRLRPAPPRDDWSALVESFREAQAYDHPKSAAP